MCAGGFPFSSKAHLPTLEVKINGRLATALLDSGCSRSIVSPYFVSKGELNRGTEEITMMNGDSVMCVGHSTVDVVVEKKILTLDCLVSKIIPAYDALLGMDAIGMLGGVSISRDGQRVRFYHEECSAGVIEKARISDKDFTAELVDGQWLVSWNWLDDGSAPRLTNSISQYRMKPETETAFSMEIDQWIENGWLQRYDGEHDGIVPLMAVVQPRKNNVRPVLDFRELNSFVSSHTGSSVVCSEKIRQWRKLGTQLKLLDLKKAYLQIGVDPSLWRYQVVIYKNVKYCLTRLGFGLNVAPKIMTAIVNYILEKDPAVRAGTDSYIDDIVVNQNIVQVERVEQLLQQYGLEAKPAVPLSGSRVLGLRIFQAGGELMWTRDNAVEPVEEKLTKREVFSWCGKLVGHFPVAAWLRPACSFVKRVANSGGGWDDPVSDRVMEMVRDLMSRVGEEDPVKGVWAVPMSGVGRVWCDASSLAIGTCLEVDGRIVEDGCWLRREEDAAHINLAELESILKGVNLAIAWGIRELEIMTDSSTVHGWITNLITDKSRLRSHGMGEALIRRRLGLLADTISECGVQVTIVLVKSLDNKADRLTRVPKVWLKDPVCCLSVPDRVHCTELIRRVHEKIHCGVDKTWHLVRVTYPELQMSKRDVQSVVNACTKCKSIDPAPVQWKVGKLDVEKNWERLACDVTHYNHDRYLTLIDSGPSRFAIWKPVSNENVSMIINALLCVFREMGFPKELLLDNSPTFKSDRLVNACEEWGVRVIFRAAYRPSGNGIVERHHRTIKRMAARTGETPLCAVHWYNFLPLNVHQPNSAPHRQLFRRRWRNPLLPPEGLRLRTAATGDFVEGDTVFVKPPGARCTTPWGRGTVTAVTEEGAVEVDGIHRHVSDLRRVRLESNVSSDAEESSESEDYGNDAAVELRRSSRVTARPWRYSDSDYTGFN